MDLKRFLIIFILLVSITILQAQNNTAYSEQTGRNNETHLQQIGDGNQADAFQEGNYNQFNTLQNGANNHIYVASIKGVGGYDPSDYNIININQAGENNASDIRVISDGNENEILHNQDGNYHSFILELNQRSDMNDIHITQNTGNGNQGNILYNGSADDNFMRVFQHGSSNLISGHITGGPQGHGDLNTITTTQTGDGNKIGGSLNAFDGIYIFGNLNRVTVTQTGQNNLSLNSQVGNGNIIDVTQTD